MHPMGGRILDPLLRRGRTGAPLGRHGRARRPAPGGGKGRNSFPGPAVITKGSVLLCTTFLLLYAAAPAGWLSTAASVAAGKAPAQAVAAPSPSAASGPSASKVQVTIVENQGFVIDGDVVTIAGNIRVVQGKTQVTAAHLVYDQKAQTGVFAGDVSLKRPDVTLRCSQLQVNFRSETALARGQVHLVQKTKADPEAQPDFILDAPLLTYESRSGNLSASGGVHLQQGARTAQAQKVDYDKAKNLLTLTGQAVVEKPAKEHLTAETILVYVGSNRIEVRGPVEAEFTVDDNQPAQP